MTVTGKLTRGVGGLYTVMDDEGREYLCRARGHFRRDGISPTVGDDVTVLLGETEKKAGREPDADGVIDAVLPRRSLLIRPPMANLDVIFAVIPTCRPAPDLLLVDKLLSIAEHADIDAAVIITKCELDPAAAASVSDIYTRSGYRVFTVSSYDGIGVGALSDFVGSLGHGAVTAFAGASGAGKSTLLNRLFPALSLETGELSRKILRGKQTTRRVDLFPTGSGAYIADTPGFSLLDFERFDFFSVEALPFTFREFEPYHGKCRYTKCTHVCEDGCAVIAAVGEGKIPRERHDSYRALYEILKDKRPWDKK